MKKEYTSPYAEMTIISSKDAILQASAIIGKGTQLDFAEFDAEGFVE